MTDSIDRDPSQRSRPQRRRTTPPPVRSFDRKPTYEITDKLSDDPTVTLLFEGLLWFMYHGSQECQVGIHNSTKVSLPHPHQHELEIRVWEKEKGCNPKDLGCCIPYVEPIRIPKPTDIAGIQIDVNRPVKEGVYVYQNGRFCRPDTQYENDPYDWRWITDFEYYPLYPEGITLDPQYVNPGVWINNGTFFTLQKTTYHFDLHPASGSEIHSLGNVALLAGAYIDLTPQVGMEPGGDVTLTIREKYPKPSRIIRLPYNGTKRYQIDIRNECMKGDKRCEPGDFGTGSDRNDFYLYNKTFKAPQGRQKYTLHRVEPYKSLRDAFRLSDRANMLCLTGDDQEHIHSNNEAPCGPVCASGGGAGG